MLSRLFYLFALLATAVFVSAQGDDAWHLDYIYVIGNEELDPIVSPNQQASHMHKIIGGSRMAAFYNTDYYSAASCSSCRNQADKSNYWMPNLYVIDHDTNKYVPVPAHVRFYYFLARNSAKQPVTPFPKGLRILTGNPNNKSPTNVAQFTCQVKSDFTNSLLANNFNFARDCPWGMKTELFFPPCWDGVNLYKTDGSHMSYPDNGVRSGACPWSHPVRLPAIQLEYTWATSNYNPGQALAGNLAWANGDTTGYGVHGDFVEGWDQAALGAALNDSRCVNLGYSIAMTNCPAFDQYMDDNAAKNCQFERGQLTETFGNADNVPIPRLPGCNPEWGTDATKPGCSPAIAGLDVSKFTGTDGSYVARAADNKQFKLPTTPGWTNIACLKEVTSITGGVAYTDAKMTVESCTASCLAAGYNYAGMGQVGAWNCVCGTGIRSSASTVPGVCTTPCPGNSAQQCGGSYIFNIWYAPPGTQQNQTTLADGSHYVGCYNNPSTASNGLIGAATYSFQSNSMTTEVCLQACHNMKTNWALTTSAKWCYCGNDWKFGSGALVPASYCTVPCTGNSSQACGDYYRSSVYNITDADIEHSSVYHPAGWQGCYQDLSGRVGLTNNSWTSTAATPQMCIDGCSELGYKYAGVENGKQCFCGNVPQTTTRLPVSQCNTPCAGNSTGVCGGPSAMDLYTTTNAKVTVQSKAATKPEGYLGCFLDAGSNIAFPNYYSYNFAQMTVEVCKQSCLELGYSYAGVENGNQCRCGNTAPQTAQYVQSLTCTKNCTGNAAQTCGAGGYLEAYALSNATLSPIMPGSSSDAYVGCYENSNRGLTAYTYYDNTITVEKCRTTCSEFGYSLASVYLSKYCGCGNSWVGAAQKYASSYCQYYKCGGNSTEYCGGQTTAALYNTSDVTVTINKPDGWVGCWTDNSNSRTLQGYAYNASPMSSKACRIACANQGFAYAGTEFGSQCFCGNEIANGAKAPTSSCSTKCSGYANETCGGGGFMDLYNATGAVANNGVQGYLGCFTDDSSLNGASYTSDYMSIDTCNQWCFARNFAYAGVRNGNQCKCGNTSPSLATTTASCVNACSANSKQNCGTASTIATYDLAKTGIKSGDFVATSNSTGYVGCYSEGSTRMLPSYYFSQSGMTNDICISNCKALGYDLAGTEFGTQCYCADKLDATSGGYRRQETACSMACGGKDGICGNANVLSVWSTANATSAVRVLEGYKGCFAVGTFGNAAPLTYSTGTITTELCRRTCKNAGYSIAGLTNGNTCTCGNNPTYGATVAPVSCNAPCQGNTTQTCGGQFSKAWSIYDTTGAGAGVPAGYPANYVGCVVDGSPRVLPNYYINNGGMSSDACRKICVGAGYSNYGTEAGTQCFCGANKLAVPIIPDSQCNTKCPGAPTEMCGGGGRLSYYRVDNTTSVTPSASASVSASASASASASKSASSSAVVSSSSSKAASSSSAASSSASKAASSSSAAAVSSTSKAASSSAAAASSSTSKAASSSAAAASSSASKASSAAASSSSSKAASVSTSRIGGGAIATDGTAVETQSATEPVTASSTSAVQSSVTAPVTSSSTQAAASSAAPASSSSESPAPASSSAAASSSISSEAASSSAAASSSTTTQAAPSSAAASSSTTSSAPAPSGTALGCYKGSNTAFSSSIMVGHDNLTPAMCQIWCNANYYTYAGVSGGTTCGCSNTLTGLTSTAAADCSIPCSGNPQINCGGTGNSTYGVFQAQAAVRPAKRFDSNSESIRRPRNERDTQRRIVHAPRADANSKRRRGGLFSKW